jgi:hypothetical protein
MGPAGVPTVCFIRNMKYDVRRHSRCYTYTIYRVDQTLCES